MKAKHPGMPEITQTVKINVYTYSACTDEIIYLNRNVMKIEDHNLFIVVNIFGTATLNYSLFTNYTESLTFATKQGVLHNDTHTQYEVISLPYYQYALMGYGTLLEAYNLYCKD